MKTALVVKTTGEMYEIDISKDSYKPLKEEIGGWLEAIDLSEFDASNPTMWLDEEGKLKSLKHNLFAQRIFDCTFGPWKDAVVGDVVFTGGTDRHGNTMGLTTSALEKLRRQVMVAHRFLEPRMEFIEIQEVQ
jgi:hypothetical protein